MLTYLKGCTGDGGAKEHRQVGHSLPVFTEVCYLNGRSYDGEAHVPLGQGEYLNELQSSKVEVFRYSSAKVRGDL